MFFMKQMNDEFKNGVINTEGWLIHWADTATSNTVLKYMLSSKCQCEYFMTEHNIEKEQCIS